MKTRIKSKSEFKDKMAMAQSLQKSIKNKTTTEQNLVVFHVLVSELTEFRDSGKLKKAYNIN